MHTTDRDHGGFGRDLRRVGPCVTRMDRSRVTTRLLVAGGVLAAALAATPAVLGLTANSSSIRDTRVPVHSRMHLAHFSEPDPSASRMKTHDGSAQHKSAPANYDDHGRRRDDDAGITRSRDDRWLRGDDHDVHGRTAGHGPDDPRGDR